MENLDEVIASLMEKLRAIPNETEISTSELVDMAFVQKSYDNGIYQYEGLTLTTKDYFELDSALRMKAKKEHICLDSSKYACCGRVGTQSL